MERAFCLYFSSGGGTIIFEFRTKLTILISTIVLIGFVGSALLFTRYSMRVKEKEILIQQDRLSERITVRLDSIFKIPEYINGMNNALFPLLGNDTSGLEKLQHIFVSELQKNPQASIIAIGLEDGNYREVQRLGDGSIRKGYRSSSTGGALELWEIDADLSKTRLAKRIENYDHRKRPWYLKGEGWSGVYFYASNHNPAISYSSLVTDTAGKIMGVFTTSISLSSLSTFLKQINISSGSRIMVMDAEGCLVGTSFRQPLVDSTGNRIHITATANPEINKMAALYLKTRKKTFTYFDKNGTTIVKAIPLVYQSGITWNLLVMTPEKDFTRDLDIVGFQNIVFLSLIFLLSMSIIFVTSRTITKPIKFLADNISQISYSTAAKTELVIPPGLKNSSKEIRILADSLDIMLERLRSAFSIIEKSRREYKDLVENINTIIMTVTPDGTITYCNPYGLKFYGYSESELIGKTVQDTVLRGNDEEPLKILKSIFSQDKKYWNGENKNITKDGHIVWILWSNHLVLNKKGEVTELLSTGQDITARKETEREMAVYLKRNTILLGEIHHRVKNNLQIIISIINLQLDRTENREIRSALLGIKTRIQSMALVHEMLYSSSSFSDIDLKQYISSLLNDIIQTFRDDNKRIDIAVSAKQLFIELEQAITVGIILSELISNAVKYAFKGRDSGRIEILLDEPEEGTVDITVKDNGSGIDTSRSKPEGLGTVLIDALIQQLGAKVQTEESEGYSFRFTFTASRRKI